MKSIFLKTAAGLAAAASVLTSVVSPVSAVTRIDYNPKDGDDGYGDWDEVNLQDLIVGKCYVADLKEEDVNPEPYHSKYYVNRWVVMVAKLYERPFPYPAHTYYKADVIDCENGETKTVNGDWYVFYPYDRKLGPAFDVDNLYHSPYFN